MRDLAPEAVDARRVMEEIRRRIAERKAAGEYSDAEIAEIASMELRLQEGDDNGGETDRHLSWLHAHWEATGPVAPEGMRPAGPLREAVKRALRALLAPAGRILLGKQNQINARLVQLLSTAVPPLRQDVRDVEERVSDLAVTLEKENSRLEGEVRNLAARLERIEKEAAGGGRRQEE